MENKSILVFVALTLSNIRVYDTGLRVSAAYSRLETDTAPCTPTQTHHWESYTDMVDTLHNVFTGRSVQYSTVQYNIVRGAVAPSLTGQYGDF